MSASPNGRENEVGNTCMVIPSGAASADEKSIAELETWGDDVVAQPATDDPAHAAAANASTVEGEVCESGVVVERIVMEAIHPDDEEPAIVPQPPSPQAAAPTTSGPAATDTKSTFRSMFTIITKDMLDTRLLFYLSIFSIIGSILRVFIGRLFGLDCDGLIVDDVFHQGFAKICVTATGLTEQTGGTLFIDLPANMIGSMMMGVMTPGVSGWPGIPWLRAENPLQQDKAMNIAIRTGLCGSLTTFASWNSQMVVMMDGFQLPLGHQILPAIFGYIIGLQVSIACFLFGRKANTWINQYVNPNVCSEMRGHGRPGARRSRGGAFGLFANRPRNSRQRKRFVPLSWTVFPVLLVVVSFSLFVVSDVVWNISFYRTLWVSTLFTPFGAIARWRLSLLNPYRKTLPLGTLIANILGSVVAILAVAIERRYLKSETLSSQLLAALKIGFAGSLSTVSTFVKEVVDLTERYSHDAKGYKYAGISLVVCCAAGVVVYSPIVRS